MAAFDSSSLSFSNLNPFKKRNGIFKKMPMRISKQHLVEHKIFGSKRKNIQIGKTFSRIGAKDHTTKSTSSFMSPRETGLSPSLEEFDKMLNGITEKKLNTNPAKRKKSLFSRKQFG